MNKSGIALLVLTALIAALQATSAAAVNPFVVDDARVNEPGQCQLEGFVLDQRRANRHSSGLVLGCTPAQRFQQSEFSAGMYRTDADGQIEQKSLDLGWKGLWKPLQNDAGSLGLGASLGSVRQHQPGESPLWHPYFNLIASATLLDNLVLHANAVVGRAALSEHVWEAAHEPASNAVDVCVKRLRQKIDRRGQPSLILTRRGEGYMLATPSAT